MTFLGAIDQGTTSTRFMVFDEGGQVVAVDQREHRQIYPQPGWVEHDAAEIWAKTQEVVEGGLAKAGLGAGDLDAVGITNQRETTVLWDTATGEPLAPAIVWQDVRTADLIRGLEGDAGPDRFRDATGLPLATYFSAPKMRWLLDDFGKVPSTARLGTIDSWLIWNLTGRHVTDPTNASRTMLMRLDALDWDPRLCEAFGVPVEMLPAIEPSIAVYGEGTGLLAGVPIAGALGDQQAALFGQAGFEPGRAKNTYGTGCFLLANTGGTPVPSSHGLLTTVAYQGVGAPASYALEGSVAIAGAAIQWLRDNLGLIDSAGDVEGLARSVDDNGGVYFVPAFSGLFAPWWRTDARGTITGLTRYATSGHLARAALEATALQTLDVVRAMEADAGRPVDTLLVDGGMVGNDLLMQFQADILGIPVVRPRVAETTALGAAYAAGLAVGVWGGLDEIAAMWREDRRWEPAMAESERERLISGWHEAVRRTLA